MTISFILTCLATIFSLNGGLASPAYTLFTTHGILESAGITNIFSLQKTTWAFLGPLIALCTIAPWISSISTLRAEKLPLSKNLISLLVLLMLGFGISLSNTLEAGKALFSNRTWEYTRTPKFADPPNKEEWRARKYQTALDPLWILELLFAGLGAFAINFAIGHSNYSALSILIPFTVAYSFVSFLTVLQSRRQKVS
jgi:hypothetical protein